MPPRASSSTSSNPSTSKKRKTAQNEADSDEAPPPHPSPSTSFFFADGNVLLQVEATLFKVHRGVLEKAEVFADTLLVGEGPGGEEGGRMPTIKLADSVEDWEVFLRALYDGLSFFQKFPTLLETRSLLLLADKYNHPSISTATHSAFNARSRHEKELDAAKDKLKDADPYEHDVGFPPCSDDTDRAMLALQEDFRLDRSSVRWILNNLAFYPPEKRSDFIKGYDDIEHEKCWYPRPMSKDTRCSLLLRVEAFSILSSSAMRDDPDKLHEPACKSGSTCRIDWDLDTRYLHTDLAQQDSYEDAIDARIRHARAMKTTLAKGCYALIRAYWEERKIELATEMEKDFDL